MSHGLYQPSNGHRTLVEELHAWRLVLPPTAAFTHLTAARLAGWWLPATPPHPVFAALRENDPRRRRTGLLVCRHPEPIAMKIVDGLQITTPAETLLACARDLGTLDLVVLGDSALRQGDVTITELKIAARRQRRGAPLLRSVIELLDKRSESAWESIMRVLHHAAEIPVEPQQEIVDANGRIVARADLLITGTRRLHEYDGDVHRTPEGQAYDLRRERALLAAEYQRVGFTSVHLLRESRAIITEADQLLERPWAQHRWVAWEQLLNTSMLRAPGRARALQHWQRAL